MTGVGQAIPRFHSAYSGPSSLVGGKAGVSGTATLFLGIRAVDQLDVYLEPELATSTAPGQGTGLAGPADGDAIGPPHRVDAYLARAFLRWRVGIGPERAPEVRLGRARYLVEASVPATRLVLSVGQLAVTDLLDQNAYANSPRTQFLNQAFVNELTYDYPQDLHGYSRGVFASFVSPSFAARLASFQVPSAPGEPLSWHMGRDRGDAIELALGPGLIGRWPGIVRLLAWRNQSRMGRYRDALRAGGTPPALDGVRRPAVRAGLAVNLELPIADQGATGLFARAGLARGSVEPLVFAEADAAASAGAQLSGRRWGRADDVVGLAAGVALASADHRAYLTAGGGDLRLGDGALRYGPEVTGEGYYALALSRPLVLTADVQGIGNPGFNRDRGPVLVLSLRVHLEL